MQQTSLPIVLTAEHALVDQLQFAAQSASAIPVTIGPIQLDKIMTIKGREEFPRNQLYISWASVDSSIALCAILTHDHLEIVSNHIAGSYLARVNLH